MSIHQLLLLFYIQLIIVMLPAPGLYTIFKRAGIEGWKAFVPFYNTYLMLRVSGSQQYLFYLQFVPIVGWFISMRIFILFVQRFGKYKFYQHMLTALLPLVYFIYLAYEKKLLLTSDAKAPRKTILREWADAAIFAIVAATLIRIFVFEAYAIPTGSMEKTLLVNDYLFVSKMAYGPRIPNTPLALPFIHNSIPGSRARSYVEWIKIPYTRWFASPIKRNDVVVFNLPVNDTLINTDEFDSKDPYYDVIRRLGEGNSDEGRNLLKSDPDQYPLLTRPVDKRENYVKRCVAISGDTLQIKDQVIYINGNAQAFPPRSETYYYVTTAGQPMDEDAFAVYHVDINKPEEFMPTQTKNVYRMLLTQEDKKRMIEDKLASSIVPEIDSVNKGSVFPYDKAHPWTEDEFGPLWIPKQGATLTLTANNYSLFERVIRTYEGNTLTRKNEHFFINGKETNQYTFKMNYYWMMGDNRHNSQDARFWGFVPEDHIVGKASFVWMSVGNGIRWNRMFKKIR